MLRSENFENPASSIQPLVNPPWSKSMVRESRTETTRINQLKNNNATNDRRQSNEEARRKEERVAAEKKKEPPWRRRRRRRRSRSRRERREQCQVLLKELSG